MSGGILDHCHIAFAVTKHLNCVGRKQEAFAELQRLVQFNLHPLVLQNFANHPQQTQAGVPGALPAESVHAAVGSATGITAAAESQRQTLNKLMSKCYLKLGEWLKEIQVGGSQ